LNLILLKIASINDPLIRLRLIRLYKTAQIEEAARSFAGAIGEDVVRGGRLGALLGLGLIGAGKGIGLLGRGLGAIGRGLKGTILGAGRRIGYGTGRLAGELRQGYISGKQVRRAKAPAQAAQATTAPAEPGFLSGIAGKIRGQILKHPLRAAAIGTGAGILGGAIGASLLAPRREREIVKQAGPILALALRYRHKLPLRRIPVEITEEDLEKLAEKILLKRMIRFII